MNPKKNIKNSKKNKNSNPLQKIAVYFKIHLIVAIISFITFAKIDQTLEIYRTFALDKNYIRISVSILFLSLLSVVIWHSARLLSIKYEEYDETKIVLTWLPRILGISPLFGLAYGFYEAARAIVAPYRLFLYGFASVCILIAALLIFVMIHRMEWFGSNQCSTVVDRN